MTQQLRKDERITGTQGTDRFSKRTVASLFLPISLLDKVGSAMKKANNNGELVLPRGKKCAYCFSVDRNKCCVYSINLI